ncbi:hypothetical protein Tco_0194673 [Tanacetum coccineum]
MFQQHQSESFSEAWTRFKDLLQKLPHHGIDLWLQIQYFNDRGSFHLKCDIDRAACSKLRDKNAEESWEIIENLALYDHEGWNDPRDFAKPVKAISIPQIDPIELVDRKKEMEGGTDDESVRSIKEELTRCEIKAEVLVEMLRRILEWGKNQVPSRERMGFNLWRSKVFDNICFASKNGGSDVIFDKEKPGSS